MALGLEVKRAFTSGRHTKSSQEEALKQYIDRPDLKARHILGLDETYAGPERNDSASSNYKRIRGGVTFSDATTVAVSLDSTSESSVIDSPIAITNKTRKSVLVKHNRKNEFDEGNLRPEASTLSLRSFYDKGRTPLVVSQQTSDSSSRDFALRRGAPSVISSSSQEMEHSRQIHLFSRSYKKQPQNKNGLAPPMNRASPTASQRSAVPSVFDEHSEAGDSIASQQSISRISVTRSPSRQGPPSAVPAKHPAIEHPLRAHPVIDPARAKINIRRPKVGTKHWFDDLESDSSEDEGYENGNKNDHGPELENQFAAEIEAAFDNGRVAQFPPRSSSRTLSAGQAKGQAKEDITAQKVQQLVQLADDLALISSPKRKRNPFEGKDLAKQSVLSLGLSDSEDDKVSMSKHNANETEREIRISLVNGPLDETKIEVGQALAVGTKKSGRQLERIRAEHMAKPSIPRRASSKVTTCLDDKSTDTLKQSRDLLTSFPRAPSEASSKGTSVRESTISDNESTISTKLMTVTRQEEKLIAAMRLKKVAMRRAQTMANRRGTLQALELDGGRSNKVSGGPQNRKQGSHDQVRSEFLPGSSPLPSRKPFTVKDLRPDSCTTFQTESHQGRSVRSSIATYLSEGSDDLQLPYSSIDGLPVGSTTMSQQQVDSPELHLRARDTFLSEMTTESTVTATSADWRSSVRNSHVVVLDPLDHQLLRETIPSQLFMESPFLGWEARAGTQASAR